MNKKGFFDFELDQENLVALGLAVAAGFISLVVMKSVENGIVWKIITFLTTTAVSYFVIRFIASRG